MFIKVVSSEEFYSIKKTLLSKLLNNFEKHQMSIFHGFYNKRILKTCFRRYYETCKQDVWVVFHNPKLKNDNFCKLLNHDTVNKHEGRSPQVSKLTIEEKILVNYVSSCILPLQVDKWISEFYVEREKKKCENAAQKEKLVSHLL